MPAPLTMPARPYPNLAGCQRPSFYVASAPYGCPHSAPPWCPRCIISNSRNKSPGNKPTRYSITSTLCGGACKPRWGDKRPASPTAAIKTRPTSTRIRFRR